MTPSPQMGVLRRSFFIGKHMNLVFSLDLGVGGHEKYGTKLFSPNC